MAKRPQPESRPAGRLPAPDDALDHIGKLAARALHVPFALIRLLDREGQWSVGCYGAYTPETLRDSGFCARALAAEDVDTIADTLADPQFRHHPLVKAPPGIRSYAGVALRSAGNAPLGALCVFDTRPRELTLQDAEAMRSLVALAVAAIEQYAADMGAPAEGQQRQPAPEGSRVLKEVARGIHLRDTLTQLIQMIERGRSGLFCSILLQRDGRLYLTAAPSLPESYREAVEERLAAGGAMPDIVPEGFQAIGSIPIVSDSGESLGLFFAFCRDAEETCADGQLLRMAARLAAIAVEQRQLTEQLAHLARHDSLTGLPNRAYFADLLSSAIAKADRFGQEAALVFLDLDRFKQVNDTLGHSAGDALLRQVAQRLRASLREGDNLARLGGDEFALLLSGLQQAGHATVAAERVLEALRAPFLIEDHELVVTASAGISVYPEDARDAGTLLRQADRAMYRVKNHGKNAVIRFSPQMTAVSAERFELEAALRHALERNQLDVRYQPQVDREGRIDGLEVLLAWQHPDLGSLTADRFIPIAEESGLIVPIGNWVLREACRQNAAWRRSSLSPGKIAVNVSSVQFARPDFVGSVAAALKDAGLEAQYLELEITESLIMRDMDEAVERMKRLRTLGVGISIDDFGTGYSSLSYLRRLPVDTLKIDRSFLDELESPRGALSLIRTIVELAHGMGLIVVIEGVETESQLELLRTAGYDRAQGHLFGEALRAADAEQLLRSRG